MSSTATALQPPTVSDILAARKVVQQYLQPTPTIRPPALSDELGCDVVLKCENMQPIGAFKIRGGVYLMSQLSDEERSRGVVTASTGNHSQSVAYAARLFGIRAVIFVPEVNNPAKVAATRRLGAEIVEVGPDFDTANEECRRFAEREGMRYIHPANEPLLIAGVGTYALELIQDAPDLDVVIVPVGGGSGVCATATVFKAMRPETQVLAVQTANMPAVHDSFHQQQMLAYDGGRTWAEGLATRVAFDLPFRIMQELVDDVLVVSEQAMRESMVTLMETARIVAEGAGAAPLAAARDLADELRGKHVGLVISGGNVTGDTLRRALCDDGQWE